MHAHLEKKKIKKNKNLWKIKSYREQRYVVGKRKKGMKIVECGSSLRFVGDRKCMSWKYSKYFWIRALKLTITSNWRVNKKQSSREKPTVH